MAIGQGTAWSLEVAMANFLATSRKVSWEHMDGLAVDPKQWIRKNPPSLIHFTETARPMPQRSGKPWESVEQLFTEISLQAQYDRPHIRNQL